MLKPKRINEIPFIILYAISYVAGSLLITYCNSSTGAFNVFGLAIERTSVCGIITQILQILSCCVVIYCRKYGYKCALTLMSCFLLTALYPILSNQVMNSLPGVVMIFCGFVLVVILHSYVEKIDRDEAELAALALTDALTGIPNRRAFMNHFHELASKENPRFALVFIDIDRFKNINDTLGHDIGDFVLIQTVDRWRKVLDENDFIARLGGDEFALIVENYTSIAQLKTHIEHLYKVLRSSFLIDEQKYFISASFGVVLCPEQSRDPKELLRYVDMAMYIAKRQSRSKVCFYENSMTNAVETDAHVENVLRKALSDYDFGLVFQPQFESEGRKLRGFETLIRMNDSNGEPISPTVFIPVAEKCGAIIEIERWVMKTAMTLFQKYLTDENRNILLSINISPLHLQDGCFLSDVEEALAETNFPADKLEIEITESVFISSVDVAIEHLNALKKLGVKIALDDFGTGYASLSFLQQLPIDLLKIDKAFIADIANGSSAQDFVEAIIAMGHVLHLYVISEGVETDDQLEILKSLSCDHIQGYVWGKPVDIDTAVQIIEEYT